MHFMVDETQSIDSENEKDRPSVATNQLCSFFIERLQLIVFRTTKAIDKRLVGSKRR